MKAKTGRNNLSCPPPLRRKNGLMWRAHPQYFCGVVLWPHNLYQVPGTWYVGRRIGTDTGCAGCRWVGRTVYREDAHMEVGCCLECSSHRTKRTAVVVNTEMNSPAVWGAVRVTTRGHAPQTSNRTKNTMQISTTAMSSRTVWQKVQQRATYAPYHVPGTCGGPSPWKVYNSSTLQIPFAQESRRCFHTNSQTKESRRSTIEVCLFFSEASHLRSSIHTSPEIWLYPFRTAVSIWGQGTWNLC